MDAILSKIQKKLYPDKIYSLSRLDAHGSGKPRWIGWQGMWMYEDAVRDAKELSLKHVVRVSENNQTVHIFFEERDITDLEQELLELRE